LTTSHILCSVLHCTQKKVFQIVNQRESIHFQIVKSSTKMELRSKKVLSSPRKECQSAISFDDQPRQPANKPNTLVPDSPESNDSNDTYVMPPDGPDTVPETPNLSPESHHEEEDQQPEYYSSQYSDNFQCGQPMPPYTPVGMYWANSQMCKPPTQHRRPDASADHYSARPPAPWEPAASRRGLQHRSTYTKAQEELYRPLQKRLRSSSRPAPDHDQLRIHHAADNFRSHPTPRIEPETLGPRHMEYGAPPVPQNSPMRQSTTYSRREDPYRWEESYQPPPFTLHAQNDEYNTRYSPKLPIFTGKIEEWDAFWLQFTTCTEALNLNGRDFATQLLLSLKGTAMTFVAGLNMDTVRDPKKLVDALKSRFGHQVPAQTHRAALANLRKSSTETLQDFASKVQAIMTKAYPDIEGTETFTQLAIQHFLNGIPDQDLSFEVMKLSPRSLAETTDRLIWLESCKQSTHYRRKTNGIRCVNYDADTEDDEEDYQTYQNYNTNYSDTDDDYEEQNLRRINGKHFVTEDRLIQLHRNTREREFRKLKEEVISILKAWKAGEEVTLEPEKKEDHDKKQRVLVCYSCQEEGHISPRCPRNPKIQSQKNLNFNGLSLMAKPQPKA